MQDTALVDLKERVPELVKRRRGALRMGRDDREHSEQVGLGLTVAIEAQVRSEHVGGDTDKLGGVRVRMVGLDDLQLPLRLPVLTVGDVLRGEREAATQRSALGALAQPYTRLVLGLGGGADPERREPEHCIGIPPPSRGEQPLEVGWGVTGHRHDSFRSYRPLQAGTI